MEQVRILLVGIGGYAEKYIEEFMDRPNDKIKLVGVCDPFASKSKYYDSIIKNSIPIYNTPNEFFKEHKADLAVIGSPIQFHCDQTLCCVENDCNVLCEKPLCADLEQASQMLEAEKKTGKFVAVGYQLCFSPSVIALKNDILSGKFGKPIEMKTIHMMRRGTSYYARNNWAGKIKNGDFYVYDSPFSNACAHQFHNMLFLLGEELDTAVSVKSINAELFRANPNIENFDAVALRCETSRGINIMHYTAHCLKSKNYGPISEYIFENAVITFDKDKYIATLKDGTKIVYGGIDTGSISEKLYSAVECTKSKKSPVCTVKTATPHMQCVHLTQKYDIKLITGDKVEVWQDKEQTFYSVPQIEEKLFSCYEKSALPNEIGINLA